MDRHALDYVKDLPGYDRGHPHYFKDPMIDHLLEIVMMIGGELWVERDRRLITEHLMATEGAVTAERLEQYQPDEDFAKELAAARKQFTQRVFGCLYDKSNATDVNEFFNVMGKED